MRPEQRVEVEGWSLKTKQEVGKVAEYRDHIVREAEPGVFELLDAERRTVWATLRLVDLPTHCPCAEAAIVAAWIRGWNDGFDYV